MQGPLPCMPPVSHDRPATPIAVGPGYRVLRQGNGYEILCLVPGMELHTVKVLVWGPEARVRVTTNPEPSDPWGAVPLCYDIRLPGAVEESSARALMTLHGRLLIRVLDAAPDD